MSKVDEKLEHFANDIMADIGEERRNIIGEVTKELKEVYDVKESEFLGNAYELIQKALIKIDFEKNEQMSKTIMDNRIKLLQKRNELTVGLLDKVIEALKDFAKTEAYLPYIMGLINEAKEQLGDGDIVISLNASDKALASEIEKETKLKVILESKKVDLIGGCKVFNKSSNTVIDYSFKRELDDQKEEFIHNCKLDIE